MRKRIYHDAVVVGGDHYNTLWVIRSLGQFGYIPTAIIFSDNINSFVAKSRYLKEYFIVNTTDELLNKLSELQFSQRTILLSTSDITAKAIDSSYTELSKKYICPNCGNIQGRISYWMDKDIMLRKAEECGFKIPQTTSLNLNDKVIYSDIKYPCIIKPQKSSEGSKDDFRICYSETDLAVSLDSLRGRVNDVLIQEYLKPDYEASILCLRSRQLGLNIIPGLLHKVRTCSSTNNMGMHTFCYVENNVSSLIDEKIVNKFINDIDYEGLYSVEFCVVNGIPYFLEVNLRVDGCQYVFTTAGANMPGLWADLNYMGSLTMCKVKENRTYGMTEISYIKYIDWKKPIEIIRDWLRTDCYSIFSINDLKPFIYKFINVLR